MQFLKPSILLISFAFLISCERVTLELDISENLTLKKNPLIQRDVKIEAGQYTGELKFKSKKVVLEIDGIKGDFYFDIPGGVDRLPENGTRVLKPSQTNQPVTTTINIKTEVLSGERVFTREACSVTQYIPCYPVGGYYSYRYPYPGRFYRYGFPYYYYVGSDAVCINGTGMVTFYGSKEVEYTPKTKNQYMDFSLSQNDREKLNANGTLTDQFRQYHFEGPCDIY